MNDVQQTTQRRRGFAWPIFTGLATVAAAVAVVVIGLGLINQRDPVGQPTAGTSASPEATLTPTPEASASGEPASSATADPTTGNGGEFGPIHSMAPEDAFANAQTCEVTDAIVNGEPTDLTWRISFPDGWSTNEESTELRSSCTLFAPEPFEAPDDQAVPASVAIVTDIPAGGEFDPGSTSTSTEYTVDGVAAVRYEVEPGGFVTEPTVVWIIAIAGSLPGAGNDQPYLAISTHSDDPDELAEWTDVLDRMVATLDIGE